MAKARSVFGTMHETWRSKNISKEKKLHLFRGAVWSTLTHSCVAWSLTEKLKGSLRCWNARCLTKITGREIRDEMREPTLDLVRRVQELRLMWVGKTLGSPEERLHREVMISSHKPYKQGSLLEDAPEHTDMEDLIRQAQNKPAWIHYSKSARL